MIMPECLNEMKDKISAAGMCKTCDHVKIKPSLKNSEIHVKTFLFQISSIKTFLFEQ